MEMIFFFETYRAPTFGHICCHVLSSFFIIFFLTLFIYDTLTTGISTSAYPLTLCIIISMFRDGVVFWLENIKIFDFFYLIKNNHTNLI